MYCLEKQCFNVHVVHTYRFGSFSKINILFALKVVSKMTFSGISVYTSTMSLGILPNFLLRFVVSNYPPTVHKIPCFLILSPTVKDVAALKGMTETNISLLNLHSGYQH